VSVCAFACNREVGTLAMGWYTSVLPRQSGSSCAVTEPHRRAGPPHVQGVTVPYWTEFKNTVLPWLLAGGVVTFLVHEHRRTTEALLGANTRLAEAVEQQGKALEGVRQLLAAQGYTLPPLNAQQ
jgi:hypothetical protein